MALVAETLTADAGFLDAAASRLLAWAAADLPDLSNHLVLVSSLPLAAELRTALARAAGRPLLLPRFDTLRRWALAAPLPAMPVPLADSERLVLLHSALQRQGWFDERALWGIAGELAALSDELTAAAVQLPADTDELVRQLERAYELRASAPLAFEARVVHEMWRALAASGQPDAPSVYRLRLAELARQAACPLFILVDGPADERLAPAERDFLARYGERQPVLQCAPVPRAAAATPLAAMLAAAWPEDNGADAETGEGEAMPSAGWSPAGDRVGAGDGGEGRADDRAGVAEGADVYRGDGGHGCGSGCCEDNEDGNRERWLDGAGEGSCESAGEGGEDYGRSVPPLLARAGALRAALPASPLAGRLRLVAVGGREAEAEAAAAQVFSWLAAGRKRIALIAEDRLTARRLRALLERRGVLAADETGWKLTTTRAAATLDALLETQAGGAYHLDLLDLCKSPHVFADLPPAARAAVVLTLERAIRRAGARAGLPAIRRALASYVERSGGTGGTESAEGSATAAVAGQLLDRVEVALRILGGKPAPLAKWLARLVRALAAIDAAAPLAADAAGGEILDLFAQRQDELADSAATFSFAAWRDWLNRELEAGAFRDRGIASGVVMLPRHDVRLRRFDAAIVIGADAEQLQPAAGGSFFNQAVRRDLGLPTRADAERALRRDLELLLCTVPEVVVMWQREHAGEARLLAPEFDLLATLHELAWGDDLRRPPLALADIAPEPPPAAELAPDLPRPAAPVAPAPLLPARVSVSGLASLVACPYQFFARHVLRLNELDEVADEMEKSDYGALVHRSLERFHAAHPRLADLDELDDQAALAALDAIVSEVFAAAEADNWLAVGWRLRWQSRLPAYLAWQREREAAGWHWRAAEVAVARTLPLPAAAGTAAVATIELYGRIDRIDGGPDGISLIDYKTKRAVELKKLVADDIQLAAYALLCDGAAAGGGDAESESGYGDASVAGNDAGSGAGSCAGSVAAGPVAAAAYVALDDERVTAVGLAGDPAEQGIAQGERLRQAFAALHAGAALPAHGADSVCRWCEASGLCRRDHVVR